MLYHREGGLSTQWEDLTTDQEDLKAVSEETILEASIVDQEKCIKQFALNVSKNVKFHSSLLKVSQFIVKNALLKESQDSRVRFL
jgi:hypothetical protein